MDRELDKDELNLVWDFFDGQPPHPPKSGKRSKGGSISPRGNCPKCKGKWRMDDRGRGAVCPRCLIFADRYVVFVYHKGKFRIYSDASGMPLDSYPRAHAVLSQINEEIRRGVFDATFWVAGGRDKWRFDKLWERYLQHEDNLVQQNIRAKASIDRTRQRGKDYILPKLGHRDVRELRRDDLFELLFSLPDSLRNNTKAKVVYHIHGFFNFLRDMQIVPQDLPKLRKEELPVSTTIPRWIDEQQQAEVLLHIPEIYRLAFQVLFETGLRPGELRALRKRSMLPDGELAIEEVFSENELRPFPKTRIPRRVFVSDALWVRLEQHAKDLLPDSWLFTGKRIGRPLGKNRLWEIFRKAARTAGYPNLKLYEGTRHAYASGKVERARQEATKTAAEQLGHTSPETTKRHYVGTPGSKVRQGDGTLMVLRPKKASKKR